MKLTAIIPALNEEIDLPRTLESLKFTDEVIIVDTGSSDSTVEIAKKFGAKVVSTPMSTFSAVRNFGDSQVSKGWILSLEADVVVPPSLAIEIRREIDTTGNSAFYIERSNIIWGKAISHTDWGPGDDCHLWLYQKGSGSWQSDVHEEFVTAKPTGKLKNRLLHYNYNTLSEFIAKTDTYSQLAKTKYGLRLWIIPVYDFLKRYFYKLGFLDGYHGLFLSYLQGIYHLNVLVKNHPYGK